MLDGSRWRKLAIVIAVLQVLIFCGVLLELQFTHTHPATGILGTISASYKTLSMGFIIVSSVLFFPVDSFKKIAEQYERYYLQSLTLAFSFHNKLAHSNLVVLVLSHLSVLCVQY